MQADTNLCTCPSESMVKVKTAPTTLLIVLYNYKGKRTYVGASFILIGTMIIAYSELYSGQVSHYYTGSVLLFIGAWANGSLFYFVKLMKSLSKRKTEVSVYG